MTSQRDTNNSLSQERLVHPNSLSKTNTLNTFHYFTFGGMSGAIAWLFIYPQDLVKTRVQASTQNITPKTIVKNIYTEFGVRGFFKGFHLALLRAVPLHAGTFAMVEYLKKSDLLD